MKTHSFIFLQCMYVCMYVQGDCKLLSEFPWPIIFKPDNNVTCRSRCWATTWETYSRDNEYAGNNGITSVAVQRAVNTTIEEEVFPT
jgi:hypothetical protein